MDYKGCKRTKDRTVAVMGESGESGERGEGGVWSVRRLRQRTSLRWCRSWKGLPTNLNTNRISFFGSRFPGMARSQVQLISRQGKTVV